MILSIDSNPQRDNLPLTEFYCGAIVPGMVNAHCHLELSYLKGMIEPQGGFAAFAKGLREARHRFSPEECEGAIRRADSMLWSQGVEAVGDISNSLLSFPTKLESRITYRTFAELYGLRTQDCQHLEPLLKHPNTSLTVHSTYSVRDRLFRQICAEGEEPLSIHLLETRSEGELFKMQGELWEWYQREGFECDFLHYGSPAKRIVESIPKNRSVMLVHNCCLKQSDIELIMNHFTSEVYWCICPRSNHYISALEPPVELLRRNGLKICVGTDSLSSNWSLSMLDELREIKGVSLEERLRWCCQNGAEALGLGQSIGTIEVGKRPGMVLLEGLDLNNMELLSSTIARRIV